MSLRAAIRARRAAPRAARNRQSGTGMEPKLRLPGSLSGVPGSLQRKSVLGPGNDAYEAEADRVSNVVAAGGSAPGITPLGAAPIQREAAGLGGTQGAEAATRAVSSGGRSLSAAEAGDFGSRFGHDFAAVRIHEGPQVDRAATAIGARAYTIGTDIALASGEYAPGSAEGRRLMAHELTHVLQQTGGAGRVQRQSIPDLGDLANRLERWGGRQLERAERYGRRAGDLAERGIDKAGELAERAEKGAEDWWNRGEGDISRIDFDGAEVKVSGKKSATYRAVSGVMPHAKDAKGVDYTDPKYQDEPDKGPIPEGSYYLDPGEVESNPPGTFNTAAWGKFRTRLHETVVTGLRRRAATERTGGFYLHQDANHNGTAGCIGIWKAGDNAAIHAMVKANSAQIPVHVDYKTGSGSKGGGAAPVQRAPAENLMQRTALSGQLAGAPRLRIQREPKKSEDKKQHYLITAGIDRINADLAKYKKGAFPSDYYDMLARHLFNVALRKNGRDYWDAMAQLDNLQWNKYGSGLQDHYTENVGTDSANGWDKFRHFVFTAYLQWVSGGVLAPEAFTYGKELYDEGEHWVGKDPEGYSVPDIRADNRGEKFAEEMADQLDRERLEAVKRKAARALDALIDPRTYGVRF